LTKVRPTIPHKKMKFLFISVLSIITYSCTENKSTTTDLEFFNLHGHIKSFAELKVTGSALTTTDLSINLENDFPNFEISRANYHLFNFDEQGELVSILNKNPSPYAMGGFNINIDRADQKLSVKQRSPKETYTQAFSMSGDSLFVSKYNKIDDNSFDYHVEKFRQKVYVKQGGKYLLTQERKGTNALNYFITDNYVVKTNTDGLEDTIYKLDYNQDTIPYFKVIHFETDSHGNWIKRQFNSLQNQDYVKFFTEYRQIEYYN
jgi:hypothetical protein